MTDTSPEPAPVRVPNVSPSAVSGLDHHTIGDDVHDARAFNAEQEALEQPDGDVDSADPDPEPLPVIPEDVTSVDDRLAWVHYGDDEEYDGPDDGYDRAVAVLLAERHRDVPRTTLVRPLTALLVDRILDFWEPELDETQPDPVAPTPDPAEVTPAPEVATTAQGDPVAVDGTADPVVPGDTATALTGVVAPPDQLAPIDSTGDGQQLPPADAAPTV